MFTKEQGPIGYPSMRLGQNDIISLKISISSLLIPILVTFDIWRNKSLQSLLLFSLPRAFYNYQRIFAPLKAITSPNLPSLFTLKVQKKTIECRDK